jgi:protein-disulfide isomerase
MENNQIKYLLSILVGVTLLLTAVNTFYIVGLNQQVTGLQAQLVLAGSNTGNNNQIAPEPAQVKEVKPTQEPAAPTINVSADDDDVLGDEDAPVTIIEFSDYECPFCARFYSQTLPAIKEKYIDTGKAKLIFRDFPLGFHADAQKAAEAAECAGEQGKYWEMHDKIFENQQAIDVASLKQYAGDIGLNATAFDQCLDSGAMADEVKKDLADGQAYGISGTPSFFINGVALVGAQPFSAFEQVIESQLSGE